jgi:hypothetical protein
VDRRERSRGFISFAPRLCCRDDLSNAISMSAVQASARPAVALFNRTSHAVRATARHSRGTNQYDCSLGPDIDTCASFLEPQTDARRPHVSPINSACEPQGQAVDVRPARSGRVARTTAAQVHANSIRGDGLRRRNECGLRSPCWSEIVHANDERTGQRADTGNVRIMTANAGMIEMISSIVSLFHMIAGH